MTKPTTTGVPVVHRRMKTDHKFEMGMVQVSWQAGAMQDKIASLGLSVHVKQLTREQSAEFLTPAPKLGIEPEPVMANNMVLVSLEHASGRFAYVLALNEGEDKTRHVPAMLENLLLSFDPKKFKAWLAKDQ